MKKISIQLILLSVILINTNGCASKNVYSKNWGARCNSPNKTGLVMYRGNKVDKMPNCYSIDKFDSVMALLVDNQPTSSNFILFFLLYC